MRNTLLAACGALLVVVAGVHVGAITWGERDGAAHPHVGTLVFKTPTGYYTCRGTLLSSTVMLTAGHCTEEGGRVNLATWVSVDPAISLWFRRRVHAAARGLRHPVWPSPATEPPPTREAAACGPDGSNFRAAGPV